MAALDSTCGHLWLEQQRIKPYIHAGFNCPCDTTGVELIPPFVGEDYFCESGYVHAGYGASEEQNGVHSI